MTGMSGHDWTEVIGAAGIFTLLVTVVTVVVVQLSKNRRARLSGGREDDYRRLAEASARAQEANERLLAAIDARLGELATRTAALERVLRDVD
ncbi:hypothetical protein GA0070558_1244 [Micromonospora haikouensis]|uniref:Uncharacterized protein n=1 Tax=Micromonospora haikouensis TaxID=686309 RepID=A0A1C4XD19_9ACTN|nr:hypothetical protein [Micromonospora haikouensis]SCF06121.1 hypothetical protein GA0070558_1244 [Micromonospora haikouensis]